MSLIKRNEFKQMTEQQLLGKLVDLEKELTKLNGQRAMHTTLESPGKVKLIRKTKARILTRMNELKRGKIMPKSKMQAAQEKRELSKTAAKVKSKDLIKKTGGKSARHE